jgi:methylation protein EvaC
MLIEFLSLGHQPLANAFSSTPNSPKVYELRVGFNCENKMVQLLEAPPPSSMFNQNYPYDSSHSSSLVKHFKNISDQIKECFAPSKVLEIGTNSLPFLKNFPKENSVGIEPCGNFAKYGQEQGYSVYEKFWNLNTAHEVVDKHGKFDLIYSANCMCHIPTITEAFQAIDYALSDNGIFIFEDPSMMEVLRHNSFDQFYDEHYSLFSVISLSNEIWKNTSLEIFDVEKLPIHGGSNRIFCKKKTNQLLNSQESVRRTIEEEAFYELDREETYHKFAKQVKKSRDDLLEWFSFIRNNDYKLNAYGATSKIVTILNYCEIDRKIIDHFVDTTPAKHNTFMPGTDIPVIPYTENWYEGIKYSWIGCWNFMEEVLKKESKAKQKGLRFLTHVPFVHLI